MNNRITTLLADDNKPLSLANEQQVVDCIFIG